MLNVKTDQRGQASLIGDRLVIGLCFCIPRSNSKCHDHPEPTRLAGFITPSTETTCERTFFAKKLTSWFAVAMASNSGADSAVAVTLAYRQIVEVGGARQRTAQRK